MGKEETNNLTLEKFAETPARAETIVNATAERIGRPLDTTESIALGYMTAVLKSPDPETFFSLVGIGPEDDSRAAALKIHNKLHELKIRQLDKMLSAAKVEQVPDLNALRELMNASHERTKENFSSGKELYIGGVSALLISNLLKKVKPRS